MLNLVLGACGASVPPCRAVPVTNLRIELRASRQLITKSDYFKGALAGGGFPILHTTFPAYFLEFISCIPKKIPSQILHTPYHFQTFKSPIPKNSMTKSCIPKKMKDKSCFLVFYFGPKIFGNFLSSIIYRRGPGW